MTPGRRLLVFLVLCACCHSSNQRPAMMDGGTGTGATGTGTGGSSAGTGGSGTGTGGTGAPTDASTVSDGNTTPMALPGDKSKCPAGFTSQMPAGQNTNFASAGQSRSFYLALPDSSFTGPRPLLVAFHGTGLSGQSVYSGYGLDAWVAKGVIVVAPDSNGNGNPWPVWDATELPNAAPHTNADLQLFDDLVQCTTAHHPVDAKRIYVAGQSAGGAMTNFMLGRRSSLLAGGIPASGVFDLTQPKPALPIDPMMVIVTWGGDNDMYSGSTGSATIDNVGYVEQAALASQYWEKQPGVHQVACHGNNLGHVWLNQINTWMRDEMLAHPKGGTIVAGETLPPLPSGVPVSCSEDAATYTSSVVVNCPTSTAAGCQQYCQLLGDCVAENGSLGPLMAQQLSDLGFAQTANICSGCISECQSDAQGSSADATVLSCISAAVPTTMCGPGIAGTAAFGTIGNCCTATPGSHVCSRYCATFKKNPIFLNFVSGC